MDYAIFDPSLYSMIRNNLIASSHNTDLENFSPELIQKIKKLAYAAIEAANIKDLYFNVFCLKQHAVRANLSNDDVVKIFNGIGLASSSLAFLKEKYQDEQGYKRFIDQAPNTMPLSRIQAENILVNAPMNCWLLRWSINEERFIATKKIGEHEYEHIPLMDEDTVKCIIANLLPRFPISDLYLDSTSIHLSLSSGEINGSTAEEKLKDDPVGTYIVRFSTNQKNYVLSLVTHTNQEGTNQYIHYTFPNNLREKNFYTFDQILTSVKNTHLNSPREGFE